MPHRHELTPQFLDRPRIFLPPSSAHEEGIATHQTASFYAVLRCICGDPSRRVVISQSQNTPQLTQRSEIVLTRVRESYYKTKENIATEMLQV